MKVEELVIEIEALPEKEYHRLRQWFLEREWRDWDAQIQADEAAGRLDFLIEEALTTRKNDQLLPL